MQPSPAVLSAVTCALLCSSLAAARSDPAAREADGPVYIVTSQDTYARSLTSLASRPRAHGDSVGGELVVAEVDPRDLAEVSHTIHAQEQRCGGYFAFASRREAEAFLQAEQSAQGVSALAAAYTLDNQATVRPWLSQVSASNIASTITHLSTGYPNRYYASTHGRAAALWIRDTWLALAGGRSDVTAELFTACSNCSNQPSVILTIRGTELPNELVVLGGHLDSISNSGSGEAMRAPGADDDASGIATLTEVLRVAMASGYRPRRTVMFMGYAAEEVGLRGSNAIAQAFKAQGRNVVGVLQLDMTNYKGSSTNDIRLMTDYTNATLNQFVRDLFAEYLAPLGLRLGSTSCGYACSDHASWTSAGFPAAMTDEGTKFSYLHTASDTLANMGNSTASSANMARMGLAFLGELGKGTGTPGGNLPPVASFTHAASGLTVSFTSTSSDPDGSITGYAWDFGDGTSATVASPSRAYAAAGTYTVRLTVTDDDGASASTERTVSVSTGGTCAGTAYTGSFSGAAGQTQVQPNGTWYQSTVSGTHRACLVGPAGTDFDLYLDRWNGQSWSTVASSTSSASTESIGYAGTAGYYRFRVRNYAGTGSYTLTLSRP